MTERTDVTKFGDMPVTLLGEEIKTGATAPDFTALTEALKPVSLSDFKGKTVIISVMPSVDTGVCAMQTTRFNKEAEKLGEAVQVLTISVDLPFALGRFCSAEGIKNALTLSDHRTLDFGTKYGFAIKELRLLARGVVVVDANGSVVHVEYCSQITDHPDYDAALKAAKRI